MKKIIPVIALMLAILASGSKSDIPENYLSLELNYSIVKLDMFTEEMKQFA